MNTLSHDVADLLLEIEREMRALGVWERNAPPADALASTQPFSIDTLALTQWLQWIFIPRIAELIEHGRALPTDCAIAPLAETVFEDMEENTDRLLRLVRQVDTRLSR